MNDNKAAELNNITMDLESLNKKFQEITVMTSEAIHRILPDDSVSETKVKDNDKSIGGHVGEIRKHIGMLNETVDRCAYNLSRLQKIS